MPAFRKSVGYVRMLAELDLLKDVSKSDEEDSRSLDELSAGDSASLYSFEADDRDRVNAAPEAGAAGAADVPIFRNADCTLTASICQKG